MDADEIRDIVRRLSDDVRAQMEPLMADLRADFLVQGAAMIALDEDGKFERVSPAIWLKDTTTHSAKEEGV